MTDRTAGQRLPADPGVGPGDGQRRLGNRDARFMGMGEAYCLCYPAWSTLTGVPGNRLTMRYALDSDGYLHWIQVCSETCRYEPGRGRELRFESFDTVLRSLPSVRMQPCLGCMAPDEYLPLLDRQRAS